MANNTRVVVVFSCTLVFLQVSCTVSQLINDPAVMTLNGFQQGEGGGDPAACDGLYHSDDEFIVSMSTLWYQGGYRCGKLIRIQYAQNPGILATVVDECAGCDNEVGASAAIWRHFNLDPSLEQVSIWWSDVY